MQFLFYLLLLLLLLLFFSFIKHNSILNQASFSLKLNFEKIKFQNRGTTLYSFEKGAYCQIFLKVGVKG